MLQRRSNTCKLETVTICHLRITGVLSSSAFVRTQARKQGLCARTHNALNLQLLARKTQPDLPFASVLCDFFICVHFSSFCWCFSASVADLFSLSSFNCYSTQHSIQAVVLLSFFPLPLLFSPSLPLAPLSVLSVLLLPPFTLLLLPSLSHDRNLHLSPPSICLYLSLPISCYHCLGPEMVLNISTVILFFYSQADDIFCLIGLFLALHLVHHLFLVLPTLPPHAYRSLV